MRLTWALASAEGEFVISNRSISAASACRRYRALPRSYLSPLYKLPAHRLSCPRRPGRDSFTETSVTPLVPDEVANDSQLQEPKHPSNCSGDRFHRITLACDPDGRRLNRSLPGAFSCSASLARLYNQFTTFSSVSYPQSRSMMTPRRRAANRRSRIASRRALLTKAEAINTVE